MIKKYLDIYDHNQLTDSRDNNYQDTSWSSYEI